MQGERLYYMIDLIIGVVATIASTAVLGLFGMIIITPYKNHQEIFKKILRLIRNYEDPKEYQSQIVSQMLITDCISNQIEKIEEVFDLMLEQKDLNPLLYKVFRYEKIKGFLCILMEYIRNPIMLNNSKEFEDTYLLDTEKLFKDLKKNARFPWVKFGIFAFILLCLFICILAITFKIAVTPNT